MMTAEVSEVTLHVHADFALDMGEQDASLCGRLHAGYSVVAKRLLTVWPLYVHHFLQTAVPLNMGFVREW